MKTKQPLLLFALLFLEAMNGFANSDPSPEKGKTIFISRCAGCHNVNKVLTGPALAGIDERHSIDWIIDFVHASQNMVKKGDKDAVALFNKFNKVPMPDHPDLTDNDIKSIVEYIKSETRPAGVEKTSAAKPVLKKQNQVLLSLTENYVLLIGLLASIALLVGSLLFAVRVKKFMKNPALLEGFRSS